MCGFAGIIDFNNKKNIDLLETVNLMGNRISHRGPDHKGYWIDDNKSIAFVHHRLSILDLSKAGNQPMTSECGRYTIVFNGEIYNHKKIRSEIENHFSSEVIYWKGKSDTETLVEAISLWGFPRSLTKIVGMFSIACWDLNEKVLFLARDRIGEKPLYFGSKNNLFAFASEIDAFKEIKDFPLEVNKDVLPFYLQRNFIPAPYSIYKDIKKLKPGTFLKIDFTNYSNNDRLIENKYWDLPIEMENSQNNLINLNDEELVDDLNNLFKKIIKEQMTADVPIGAFLSGGIDSSLVVSIMQSLTNSRVKTYTVGFKEESYNESIYSQKISEYLGTDHKNIIVRPEDVIKIIANVAEVYDEPFADVSQIPMVIISRFASKEVKVCLSGDGGDEIFGGYNRYIFGSNIWNIIKFVPYKFRFYLSKLILFIPSYLYHFLTFFKGVLQKRINISVFDQKIYKFANFLRAKSQDEIYDMIFFQEEFFTELVLGINNKNILNNDIKENPNLDTTHNMMIKDLNSYLPDDVLVKVDRATMNSSLETRLPMLDQRLISYAFRIPTYKKIRFLNGKYILKKLLKQYIPTSLFERPKAGFSVPIADWLRGPLKKWASELINPERIKKEGYFNHEILEKKWREHLSGKKNWSNFIWSILMFQVWLDRRK